MALNPAVTPPARTAPAEEPSVENEVVTSLEEDDVSQTSVLDEDYLSVEGDEEFDAAPPASQQDGEEPTPREPSSQEPAPLETPAESAQTGTPSEEGTPQTPEGQTATEPTQPVEPAAQQQTTPEEPAPTQQSLTPEEYSRQRAEWRANAEAQLAEGYFKLPQDLADELDTNPSAVVPKLMSRVYIDAIEGATHAIMSHLPAVIQNVSQAGDLSSRYERQFFEMWPQLKQGDAEHEQTVRSHAMLYRQQHPSAKPEEIMKHAGAAAVLALRLPVGAPAGNGAQPTPPAHRPMGSGAPGGTPGLQQRSSNPFEQLDEDVDAIEGEL